MIVSGFMGSPRKNGNTAFLLKKFLKEAEALGAETRMLHVPDLTIHPCTGCALCEKKGYCHFNDDMQKEVFPLMRMSDVVVIASPIYFYNVPSELKALIDRSQTLWSRKYKLRLTDPGQSSRKGFLLSVGATRGKDLFDSIHLTMKYFFRGIAADFAGELTYNRIEEPGEMKRHATLNSDVHTAAEQLLTPLKQRTPTLVFVCRDNSLTSQMAAAFAQHYAGDRIHALSAGIHPGHDIHPELVKTMEKKNLDVAYRRPRSLASLTVGTRPDRVILLGDGEDTAIHIPGARVSSWTIPGGHNPDTDSMASLCDVIEDKVKDLIHGLHLATDHSKTI
ncbi:MAG: NAD(P)H-dependent oxidoreductase [Proteobacteria bacterium]|nr:NAD(P)H-dependent oxidoreductase [Pseudomonadota bacterium]